MPTHRPAARSVRAARTASAAGGTTAATARRGAKPTPAPGRPDAPAPDPAATLALAHALRTPLTSLALGLGILDDGVLGGLNDAQRDVVRTLVAEASRLTLLVERQLDTGLLGAYAGPVDRVRIDLAELVRDAAAPIARQAQDRGVELRSELRPGVHVVADRVKLAWVAVSLMGNALRYSPEGAPIDVEVRSDGANATLTVRDRGPGLEPSVEARVFDRDGGPGLFLAREIVEAHGGSIAVASSRGPAPRRGSMFTVTLPLHPEAASGVP
jgi:signal transduction histidine kinase